MNENEVNAQEQSSDDEKEVISEAEVTANTSSKSENTTIKQEESTVAKQEVKTQETKYIIQEYKDNSKALGYSREVVTGALFNCEKSELTKTEFEELIEKFLGKKVK